MEHTDRRALILRFADILEKSNMDLGVEKLNGQSFISDSYSIRRNSCFPIKSGALFNYVIRLIKA